MRSVQAVDLFCGAGGTSTGLLRAAGRLGRHVDLLAVNHWQDAISTHELNHPGVKHLRGDLEAIDPRIAIPSGQLDLLLASPECTSHSYSRGARPISEQSRSTAWCPLKWCDQLNVKAFVIENVPAFKEWGPTNRNGRAIAARKGETYRQWLDMFRALGYTVDTRVLNAADYGAATTRRRLFIVGVKGARKYRWPEASHAPSGMLLPGRAPWRGAKEIIDWSLHGQSIFNRKKPLAVKTRERILMGAEKFWPALRPYLAILRNHMGARSADEPVPTLAAGGQHIGLVQPIVVQVSHGDDSGRARSTSEPLRTLTGSRELGVAEAFLVTNGGAWENRAQPVSDPLRALTGTQAKALVEPFVLVNRSHNTPKSTDDPLPVLNTGGHMALVEPFLVPNRTFDNMMVDSIADPLRTLTTRTPPSLVEPVLAGQPFLIPFFGERDGQAPRTHSIEDPLPTVTSHGAGGVTSPFLVGYYGTGHEHSVEEPIGTLTAKPRYGLVTPHGISIGDGLYLDIRFRMLKPHELAAAMGFPPGYQFAGTVDARVKQIGNAVSVEQAEALCFAMLA